jgi:YVTN family beta-propeller protein
MTVFAGFAAASANAAPLLWTANSNEESVSTFSSATNKEVGSPIEVGQGPNSVAITPDGRRAVVTSFLGDDVTVIETASRTPVGTISLGIHHGEQVAVSPDGKTAYVTDESDEEVHVVNVTTAKAAGGFKVGSEALALAFSPNGKDAYVGTEDGVVVVDTGTEKVVGGPIDIGGLPTSIVLTPDGKTVYATAFGLDEVAEIDAASMKAVDGIPFGSEPGSLAMSPDGERLYVSDQSAGTVTVVDTATGKAVGSPIEIGKEPREIALTPNGSTAYVAVIGDSVIQPFDTTTDVLGTPIKATGKAVSALVVAPDQSPSAAFTVPSVTAGTPATFSGAASTDPDGSVVSWNWAFGDGGTATGVSAAHTYRAAGTYDAKLGVVDNEGCGEEEVFTGRTAYCSGGVDASVTHAVTAVPPSVEPIKASLPPSNKFRFGRLLHNRHNGTARLQVKLPAAGYVLLLGNKVHAVTRKSKGVQWMWLTIHARVELNKRLKKIHRTSVKIRVTFTPNGGAPKTLHRSITLLRAPRAKHRGH